VRPAAGWAAVLIAVAGLCGDASAAVIASNAAGDEAVAFPFPLAGSRNGVFAASRPSDGHFGRPVELFARRPETVDVDVGPDGVAVAAWTERRGYGPYSVHAAIREPGGEWGLSATLSTNGAAAQAAVDASGGALVVWSQVGGAMQSAYRAPGGSFEPARDLPDSGDVQGVAEDAAGNALLVSTLDGSGRDGLLQSSYRPAGGAFGDAQPIATLDAYSGAALAMNEAGDAIVAYHQKAKLVASRRPAGGSFGPELHVSRKGSEPGRYDGCGSIAASDAALDGDGRAIVTWARSTGYDDACYNNRSDGFMAAAAPDAAFARPVKVTSAARPGDAAHVAADERGDAAVVWGDPRFSVHAIYRPAGGAVAAPVRLAGPRLGGYPDVAIDAAGRATAAWEQNDGEHTEFAVRDLTAAGAGAHAQVLRRAPAYQPLQHPRKRCSPPGTRTLMVTREVRVYRNVRSGNRPKYACLLRVGRPFALDYGFGDFPETTAPPPAIAVAGPLIAYVYFDEECGTCGGRRGLTVTDLRTRRTANGFGPLGDPDPDIEDYGSIRRLRLRRDAALAYVQCSGTRRNDCRRAGVLAHVYKMDSGAPRPTLLAKSKQIDPRFLRVSGGRVRWREGGRIRSAPLR
jgi:hypothetical protein